MKAKLTQELNLIQPNFIQVELCKTGYIRVATDKELKITKLVSLSNRTAIKLSKTLETQGIIRYE